MKWIHATILLFVFTSVHNPLRESHPLQGATYLLEPEANPYRNVSNKKEVPILCYHNIKTTVEKRSPDYTIKLDQFRAQIKMLSDSGYHTILPGELYDHFVNGATLPPKPVMLTFDDTHLEHYTMAAPVLSHAGFRGVFFTMAVVIGKQGYMTKAQIKQLSDSGHTIGGHTWDHPDLRKLDGKEWDYQLNKPKDQLEQITGKSINCFAYPYGAWNETAISELKVRGVSIAFQLSNRQSETEPLYTIRRLMVAGNWTPDALDKKIKSFFY